MKVELKNIKHAEFMSQETNCFTAFVYLDGVKSLDVSDEGQGGCMDFHELVPGAHDRLLAHCTTLPDVKCFGSTLKMTDEILIGELLEAHLNAKHQKREQNKYIKRLKTHTLYIRNDKPGVWEKKWVFDPAKEEALRRKYPYIGTILNKMTLLAGFDEYIRNVEKVPA